MRQPVEPAEDYGFFGPESITWKVWSYPTSLTVGFQRAVVVEELDPALVASVDATQKIFEQPRIRYDRTLRYFALVAFGGSRATTAAADVLVKVHSKAVGVEPYSGTRYDANDPKSQLWIQLTGWHSILKAYEMYGPGKLSAADEERYWAECTVAAELQTCDPADIPRNRAELRGYYAAMRPQLSGSEIARKAMRHLLRADVMLPPLPRALRPATWAIAFALRKATLATMPRWMRELAGLKQSRAVDVAIVPVMKIAFWTVHRSRRLEVALLRLLSPSTVPVAAPVLLGVPPARRETLTPEQARERYGYAKPVDAYRALAHRRGSAPVR